MCPFMASWKLRKLLLAEKAVLAFSATTSTFLRRHRDERSHHLPDIHAVAIWTTNLFAVVVAEALIHCEAPVTIATSILIGWHVLSPINTDKFSQVRSDEPARICFIFRAKNMPAIPAASASSTASTSSTDWRLTWLMNMPERRPATAAGLPSDTSATSTPSATSRSKASARSSVISRCASPCAGPPMTRGNGKRQQRIVEAG